MSKNKKNKISACELCEKRKYEEIWLVEVVVLFDEEILLNTWSHTILWKYGGDRY